MLIILKSLITMIINSINHYLNKAMRITLSFFMVVMIAAVVWQVFTRFVLHNPSSFTDELSRYLLMWIGILGGAYTFAIKRHLSLELLAPKLSPKGQLILSIIVNLVIITFSSVVLIYGGHVLVSSTLNNGQISPGIVIFGNHLLIGYVYLVVPIAGYLMTYFGIADIISSMTALLSKSPATAVEGKLS